MRHFGATRLETAIAIAEDFFTAPSAVVLATGFKWPDAVVGSNVSLAYDAPVLLTGDEELFAPIPAYIDQQTAVRPNGFVLGGVAAVPDAVKAQFEAALR